MAHTAHTPIDQLALYQRLQQDFERVIAETPERPRTLEEILTQPAAAKLKIR